MLASSKQIIHCTDSDIKKKKKKALKRGEFKEKGQKAQEKQRKMRKIKGKTVLHFRRILISFTPWSIRGHASLNFTPTYLLIYNLTIIGEAGQYM